jgi:hypothetical protein
LKKNLIKYKIINSWDKIYLLNINIANLYI